MSNGHLNTINGNDISSDDGCQSYKQGDVSISAGNCKTNKKGAYTIVAATTMAVFAASVSCM